MLPGPDSERMFSAREAKLFTFAPAAASSKLKKAASSGCRMEDAA
jgi:hypothetical protein